MALVRYQSPDDSAFLVFDVSRFRVEHGVFLLQVDALRRSIAAKVEERAGWNLAAMKLLEEHRRLVSCLEWLDTVGDDLEIVEVPELKHEPAIDLVANGLIAEGQFGRAYCPGCQMDYRPDEVIKEPWRFEEDGVGVRGRRSVCPAGHTIHTLTDEIDAPDLESDD